MLYAIVDTTVLGSRDPVAFARACVEGGASYVQLRAKGIADDRVLSLAKELAGVCRGRALFVVNDRADIARLSGADGVHVGQDDLPVADARAIMGEGAVIGLSTHDVAQVEAAVAQRPGYLAFGPVFASGTKHGHADVTGVEGLRVAMARVHGLPRVAIGGITAANAADCIRAGATHVAVIGALAHAADVSAEARRIVDACAGVRA